MGKHTHTQHLKLSETKMNTRRNTSETKMNTRRNTSIEVEITDSISRQLKLTRIRPKRKKVTFSL